MAREGLRTKTEALDALYRLARLETVVSELTQEVRTLTGYMKRYLTDLGLSGASDLPEVPTLPEDPRDLPGDDEADKLIRFLRG